MPMMWQTLSNSTVFNVGDLIEHSEIQRVEVMSPIAIFSNVKMIVIHEGRNSGGLPQFEAKTQLNYVFL